MPLCVALPVYDRDHPRSGVVAVHDTLAPLCGLTMVFACPITEAMYLACVECDPAYVSADDIRAAVNEAGFRSGEAKTW